MGIINALGRTARGIAMEDPLGRVNRSNENMRTRLQSVGYEEPKKEKNFLVSLFETLARPGYGANNLIREFTNRDQGATPGQFDPLKAYVRGFTLKERPTGKEVMTDLGIEGEKGMFGGDAKLYNPSPAGALGLALDIVNPLDALNWLGFGLGKTAVKGGVKGTQALERAFGSAGSKIASALGKSVDDLAAPTVGKLMSQVGRAATDLKLDGDTLSDLLIAMREGIEETGMKATSKLPYVSERPITMGLQNPLKLGSKNFIEFEIPGSGKIVGALGRAKSSLMQTKIGDALGKAFSTKHVPINVPDSVIVKEMTGPQLQRTIDNVKTGKIKVPLSVDELNTLKVELDNLPKLGTDAGGNYTSFQKISEITGIDPKVTQLVFNEYLPFTMDITDLYQTLKSASKGVDDKLIFNQAARLRKTMDMMVDNVPEQLKPLFKGTIITPEPIRTFEGSPLKAVDQTGVNSPMVNYVFNYKGVDIFTGVNTSNTFNNNTWVKLGATIQALQEMPPQNLQVIKEYVQVSPLSLGMHEGANVRGYALDGTIVLGDVTPYTVQHEYGHVLGNAGDLDLDRYKQAIDADKLGTLQPDIKEDFADAVSKYISDPSFKTQYPSRTKMIDELLQRTQTTPEELQRLIREQSERASVMAHMPETDEQIQQILKQVDEKVIDGLDNIKYAAGDEAYREVRANLTQMFEESAHKVEDFVRQVEIIFKDVPLEERKVIMETAAQGYIREPQFSKDYAPIFYSKLQKVIDEKMGRSMPVDQLKNMLKKAGVKDEELKWMGFNEFVEGKTKINKAELQEFLQMNQLEVQEVWKGGEYNSLLGLDNFKNTSWYKTLEQNDLVEGAKEYIADFIQIDDEAIDDIAYGIVDFAGDNGIGLDPNIIMRDMENINTRYSQYTLPGGEDYKELLFTLPTNNDGQEYFGELQRLERQIDYIREEFGRYSPQYIEAERRLEELEQLAPRTPKFQSGHWDEPNVVAHTRFNTRYTPEGEKVLFIEEIQSDWHQAGRESGYKRYYTPEQRSLLAQYQDLWESVRGIDLIELAKDDWAMKPEIKKFYEERDKLWRQLYESGLSEDEIDFPNLHVEHAPFEKTWPDFVVKRLQRYAAENGYDRIAWTTGAQQARRYSLSEYVDELILSQVDGTQRLIGKRNGEIMLDRKVPDSELANYVGKEVAIKLKQQGSLSGVDLEVGGEGMKGFYDKIIPDVFNKHAKKYGSKVEPIKIGKNAPAVHSRGNNIAYWIEGDTTGFWERPQDMLDYGLAEGLDEEDFVTSVRDWVQNFHFTDSHDVDRIMELLPQWAREGYEVELTPDELNDIKRAMEANVQAPPPSVRFEEGEFLPIPEDEKITEQQSIKITDKMREEVLYKGQPMFAKGEASKSKLTEKGQAALDAFLKWRDSVVKDYKKLEIPINELENYVPFIPVRGLKSDEQAAMRTLFGTGVHEVNDVDQLLSYLAKTDPNLKPRTTKAKSPAEVNKVLGKDWLTEDAALAMSLRGTRAIKAQEVASFLQGFIQKYGLSVDDITKTVGGNIPNGYKMYIIKTEGNGRKILQEVFNAAGLAEKGIDGFFIPEEMAKIYNEYTELIFGTKAKNPLLKVFDTATTAYKKVAYLWNPGHIPRDFTGNVFNGYLMGVVNPLEYIEAAKLLTNPQTVIELPSGSITVQKLLDQAQKLGILDIGASVAETPRDILDRLSLKGGNKVLNAVSQYSTLMREGTKKADLLTRFTGLLHELRQGKNLTEAAAQVKKFYFDYFDLTPFERKVMKRIIPFYTWIRKNIPLQLEQVMKNPRAFSRVQDVMNAIEGEAVDWENRPEYIRESGAFKLGDSGYYVSPNLPYSDLSKVPTNLEALLQLLSSVNPIIRAPMEIATNNQWFNGRPLEQYPGETREAPFAGLLKALGSENVPQVDKRITGHLLDQIPILRNLDIITNPSNPRQASRLSSFIGGPALYSEDSVKASEAYEQSRALQQLIMLLKDQGIDIPTIEELNKARGGRGIMGAIRRRR